MKTTSVYVGPVVFKSFYDVVAYKIEIYTKYSSNYSSKRIINIYIYIYNNIMYTILNI